MLQFTANQWDQIKMISQKVSNSAQKSKTHHSVEYQTPRPADNATSLTLEERRLLAMWQRLTDGGNSILGADRSFAFAQPRCFLPGGLLYYDNLQTGAARHGRPCSVPLPAIWLVTPSRASLCRGHREGLH